MTPPKEINKAPTTEPKEMEIYKLSNKEFRIILLHKFDELKVHAERKCNEIRKTMYEQN